MNQTDENDDFCHYFTKNGNSLKINSCENAEPLFMSFSHGLFVEEHYWHHHHEYPREKNVGWISPKTPTQQVNLSSID